MLLSSFVLLPQSVAFKELLKVVTCAVSKLNLGWPEEEVSVSFQAKRLISDFRPHAEAISNFSAITGLENHGYRAMPRIKEMLTSYLFATFLTWRKPALPS